jgi:hypothetical protein
MLPAAVELLTAIAPVLSRWGRWYVFGAQAVTAHGVPRLSADVDITIGLQPDDPARFTAEMTNAGFIPRFPDPSFVRATRVLPFVHAASGMPVDVVMAGSGLEDEFMARARTMEIGGTAVPVIELSDLIIAKVLAGRPKDLGDAAALWKLHAASADRPRILRTLQALEEALGQSDLIRTFHRLGE